MRVHQPDIDPTLRSLVPADAIAVPGKSNGFGQTAYVAMTDPIASGWVHGANIRPGFSIAMSDAHFHEDMVSGVPSCAHLKLHVRLDGSDVIGDGDAWDATVEPGRMAMLVEPVEGRIKHVAVKRDTHVRAVTMVFDRDFLAPLLSEDLPSAVLDYLKAPVGRFRYHHAPTPPAIRMVAEQLMALRPGRLADLMLEAKALELLYLWIEALAAAPAVEPLLAHNRKKAEELGALLRTREGMTMSIAQLCRTLAWNETQMMESFKQVTGTTICGYRQRLRMDAALTQLRTTDRTITDIALEAGYEHPGNFATAFKRSFGLSPRMARGG